MIQEGESENMCRVPRRRASPKTFVFKECEGTVGAKVGDTSSSTHGLFHLLI